MFSDDDICCHYPCRIFFLSFYACQRVCLLFLEMLVLSFLGLVVFMGFGFIISSVAKNESSIPPFANIFTLPQFLLGGTFFQTTAFPKWLQGFCEILPLKQLNDAMRNVALKVLP